MSKKCSKCGVEKEVGEFYKQRSKKSGLQSWCKECARESSRKWEKEHTDKHRESSRKRYEENPERVRELRRRSQHRRRYGEELEEKVRRYKEQGGKCEICGGELGEWWAAHQDHDHITNENRGLLCSGCNMGLGWFEGKALLFAAYLRKYGKVVEVKIEPSDA